MRRSSAASTSPRASESTAARFSWSSRNDRPTHAFPAVAGRGRRSRRHASRGDDTRDRRRGRPPVRTHRSSQGRGRARLRLLHELREPERSAAGSEPARGAHLRLAHGAPPAGSRHRNGGEGSARGVGGVLPRRATSGAASGPGHPARARRSKAGRSSRTPSRRPRLASEKTFRCPIGGAAMSSGRRRSSSGRAGRTGCTSASATPARTTDPGAPRSSRPSPGGRGGRGRAPCRPRPGSSRS